MTIVWLSHDVTIMWLSCDCHVTIMWLSCDAALGGHEDTVQSFSWHGDGSLLATICKVRTIPKNLCKKNAMLLWQHETLCVILQDNREKKLRVFDPRVNSSSGVSSHVPILRSNCTTAIKSPVLHTPTGGQGSQWTEGLSCSLAGRHQLCGYSWI